MYNIDELILLYFKSTGEFSIDDNELHKLAKLSFPFDTSCNNQIGFPFEQIINQYEQGFKDCLYYVKKRLNIK